MDGERFDQFARAWASGLSRRGMLRGLAAGVAGLAVGATRDRAGAQTTGLAPGAACTSSAQCSQVGGSTVCADNGIATDGALNCCRNEGGSCVAGPGCCGALNCVGFVCTSGAPTGTLPPGTTCSAASQCSQAGGPVACANNGIGTDGALNCCRYQGGACSGGAGCCEDLECVGGVCGGSAAGTLALGATCTATSQCSQAGGYVVCANNGLAVDGGLNCCRYAGGACATDPGCCANLLCLGGVCQ